MVRFRIDIHFDKRHPLWWWQRRTRGFDDRELWSLDYTIAKFVYPRLRAFREQSPVTPCISINPEQAPTKEEWAAADKEWDAIMDEMVEGFRLMAEESACWDGDPVSLAKVDQSLDLFREWFHGLWW